MKVLISLIIFLLTASCSLFQFSEDETPPDLIITSPVFSATAACPTLEGLESVSINDASLVFWALSSPVSIQISSSDESGIEIMGFNIYSESAISSASSIPLPTLSQTASASSLIYSWDISSETTAAKFLFQAAARDKKGNEKCLQGVIIKAF
ncbi:MAG TPA: hypothetical protein DHW82_04235 [Spirochaetia bacterium]|nr:MAG: hypothetical protein A2Y41_11600 [Spirochaetes bacterium GWB1_36_13]HCL56202.1 hypothetical protein [Spirochaetia bacterium]